MEPQLAMGPDGLPLDVLPASWLSDEPPDRVDDEPAPKPISVSELSAQIGLPVHAVYRLLERGAVPGVFKLDETRRKSRYYIPPDAAQRFFARGDREGS